MTYNFTRNEIVEMAQYALDNWDFGAAMYPAHCPYNLQDIVDGRDGVGTEGIEVQSNCSDHNAALSQWLLGYTDQAG
jgi:hypothetical protein